MLRFLAKFSAKLAYVFRQEFNAATADLHAGLVRAARQRAWRWSKANPRSGHAGKVR